MQKQYFEDTLKCNFKWNSTAGDAKKSQWWINPGSTDEHLEHFFLKRGWRVQSVPILVHGACSSESRLSLCSSGDLLARHQLLGSGYYLHLQYKG